jgi:hypothetical protein
MEEHTCSCTCFFLLIYAQDVGEFRKSLRRREPELFHCVCVLQSRCFAFWTLKTKMKLYIIIEQNDQNATHPYVRFGLENTLLVPFLVGGFKHFLFSISYMGCHPSHWRTQIFQDKNHQPDFFGGLEIVLTLSTGCQRLVVPRTIKGDGVTWHGLFSNKNKTAMT